MRKTYYKVYKFNELSKEAKEHAISKWYEHEDYPFLEENLKESCKEYLKESHITEKENLTLGYSLSRSQGDGLNFTGTFEWKQYTIRIIHTWRYAFAESSDFEIIEYNDEEGTQDELSEDHKDYKKFKSIYLSICAKLEKEGYSEINYRMNNEEFNEHCESNDYEFKENGDLN